MVVECIDEDFVIVESGVVIDDVIVGFYCCCFGYFWVVFLEWFVGNDVESVEF